MKKILVISSMLLAVLFFTAGTNQSSGMVGYTGSPGEGTCASCHTGGLNSGGGNIVISASPAFTNNMYVPNTTYNITVTVSETGKSLFGFDFEALNGSNTTAGNITVTDAIKTQTSIISNRNSILHKKNAGATSNSATFTFDWTAPASGAVNFYAAGIAANGNKNDGSGDNVYKTTLQLSDGSTSVGELDNSHVSVFPNPVSDNLHLQMNVPSTELVNIEIQNIEGKAVKVLGAQVISEGEYFNSFYVGDISSGVYVLKATSNNGVVNLTQKIVIK